MGITGTPLGLGRTRQVGSVDMLCRRCERRLWSPRLMKFWTASRRVWGARRLGDLLCARCGAVLPAELVTERLLGKLSQLGRFGLAGSPKTLLERAEEGRGRGSAGSWATSGRGAP